MVVMELMELMEGMEEGMQWLLTREERGLASDYYGLAR